MPRLPAQVTIAGQRYDLAHLTPFRMSLPYDHPERGPVRLPVDVTFSDHCFTEKAMVPREELTSAELTRVVSENRRGIRLFHTDRYTFSLDLPAYIKDLARRGIFVGGPSNYLIVVVSNATGGQDRYCVYFSLRGRSNGTLQLFIESAYTKPRNLELKNTRLQRVIERALERA